ILLFAIVLESFSFRTAIVESRPLKGDLSWWQFIRRAKLPELPVVLLEDSAALAGLVVALAAVSVATITDEAAWDGLGTLVIGLLLGVVAIILAVEMKSLLIGESASREDLDAIEDAINRSPLVAQIIHLRTEHLGPDEILVGAKLEFAGPMEQAELAKAIDAVEAEMRAAVPRATVIYLEPDLARTPEAE